MTSTMDVEAQQRLRSEYADSVRRVARWVQGHDVSCSRLFVLPVSVAASPERREAASQAHIYRIRELADRTMQALHYLEIHVPTHTSVVRLPCCSTSLRAILDCEFRLTSCQNSTTNPQQFSEANWFYSIFRCYILSDRLKTGQRLMQTVSKTLAEFGAQEPQRPFPMSLNPPPRECRWPIEELLTYLDRTFGDAEIIPNICCMCSILGDPFLVQLRYDYYAIAFKDYVLDSLGRLAEPQRFGLLQRLWDIFGADGSPVTWTQAQPTSQHTNLPLANSSPR